MKTEIHVKTVSDISTKAPEKKGSSLFDALYKEYCTAVFSFACYLTRDKGEAEDLYQDTWLRIAKNLPEKINPKSIKSWIFTITANLYRDNLRKKKIRRLYLLKAPAPEQCDHLGLADMGRDISRAISGLPERQRNIFLLKEVAGFRQSEISDILGIPLGTVKSLMYRAVKRLQRELSEYHPKSIKRGGSYAL
jgi:RNA polymerase sigma-70 factor (ECF subfamily)